MENGLGNGVDGSDDRAELKSPKSLDAKEVLKGGCVTSATWTSKTSTLADVARIGLGLSGGEDDERPPTTPPTTGALIVSPDGDLGRSLLEKPPTARQGDLRILGLDNLASPSLLTPPGRKSVLYQAETLSSALFASTFVYGARTEQLVVDALVTVGLANRELQRQGQEPRFSLEDLDGMLLLPDREPAPGADPQASPIRAAGSPTHTGAGDPGAAGGVPGVNAELIGLAAATLSKEPHEDQPGLSTVLDRWRLRLEPGTRRMPVDLVRERIEKLVRAARQAQSKPAPEVDPEAGGPVSAAAGTESGLAATPRVTLDEAPEAVIEGRIVLVGGAAQTSSEPDGGFVGGAQDGSALAFARAVAELVAGELEARYPSSRSAGASGRLTAPPPPPGNPSLIFLDGVEQLCAGLSGYPAALPSVERIITEGKASATGVWAGSAEPAGDLDKAQTRIWPFSPPTAIYPDSVDQPDAGVV